MRLRRSTLGDEVYESVKELVMDHRLAPGAPVRIDSLARELEVSQTPVREALARLESDGLVVKRAMVGYTVTPLLTREQFEQLFEVRLILEPPAAAQAAKHRAKIASELPDASAEGYAGYAAFTSADAEFHDAVALASGNPLLRESIARLHAHLHLHRLLMPADPVPPTLVEHQRIAEAIAAGQAKRAEEAMRAHLASARERHLRHW